MHDLVTGLEQQGWWALATAPADARRFYDGIFDGRIVVLLSDGPPVHGREAALDALCGARWEVHRLDRLRAVRLTAGTVVVRYGVVATRDTVPYSAQVSSVYVHRPDGWKLTFHQRAHR